MASPFSAIYPCFLVLNLCPIKTTLQSSQANFRHHHLLFRVPPWPREDRGQVQWSYSGSRSRGFAFSQLWSHFSPVSKPQSSHTIHTLFSTVIPLPWYPAATRAHAHTHTPLSWETRSNLPPPGAPACSSVVMYYFDFNRPFPTLLFSLTGLQLFMGLEIWLVHQWTLCLSPDVCKEDP